MCKGITEAILKVIVAYGPQVHADRSVRNGPISVNAKVS